MTSTLIVTATNQFNEAAYWGAGVSRWITVFRAALRTLERSCGIGRGIVIAIDPVPNTVLHAVFDAIVDTPERRNCLRCTTLDLPLAHVTYSGIRCTSGVAQTIILVLRSFLGLTHIRIDRHICAANGTLSAEIVNNMIRLAEVNRFTVDFLPATAPAPVAPVRFVRSHP